MLPHQSRHVRKRDHAGDGMRVCEVERPLGQRTDAGAAFLQAGVALGLALLQDGLVPKMMPRELLAHLASDVQQEGFHWRRGAWTAALPDDQPSLELLHRLGERVDRETTRAVVLEELSNGRVVSAFAAAMVWGYGMVGYGP